MDTRLLSLARGYRERAGRRGAGTTAELVGLVADRYRIRRHHRIDAIVAGVDELVTPSPTIDLRAQEALEYVQKALGDVDPASDPTAHARWRATCFDVLVRDSLNAGHRVAFLRLRRGQRAVVVPLPDGATLGVTAASNATFTDQQQRALDELAQVRDAVVAWRISPATAGLQETGQPDGDEWRDLVARLRD